MNDFGMSVFAVDVCVTRFKNFFNRVLPSTEAWKRVDFIRKIKIGGEKND